MYKLRKIENNISCKSLEEFNPWNSIHSIGGDSKDSKLEHLEKGKGATLNSNNSSEIQNTITQNGKDERSLNGIFLSKDITP